MRPSLATLVMSLAAVAGCGDNALPGQPVALADYGGEAREAVCDWAVRCRHVPDRDTCERLVDPKDYDVRRAQDAVRAGRLRYDPDLAGACVDANRTQGCLEGPFQSDVCRRVFTGLQQPGEACTSGFECPRGSVCEGLECQGQCCLGTCGPIVPFEEPRQVGIGGHCTSHFECAGDAYCETDGICTPSPTSPGERCLFGCARGDLYCDLDDLVCKAYAARGQTCDPEGVTAPPCDPAWSFCDGVCRPRPGPGETCDVDGPRACIPTSTCDGQVCVPRGDAGAPCEDGDQCTVACDPLAGKCLAYRTCTVD